MTESSDLVVIVEGVGDKVLLERALGALFPTIKPEFVVAGGKARLPVVAKTAVLLGKKPVLVVADADTTEKEQADRMRLEIRSEIQAQRRPDQVEVVMVLPYLDPAALFGVPVLERIIGRTLSESEKALAAHAPREFWKTLRVTDPGMPAPLPKLTATDYEGLRGQPPFDEIRDFIEKLEAATARSKQ